MTKNILNLCKDTNTYIKRIFSIWTNFIKTQKHLVWNNKYDDFSDQKFFILIFETPRKKNFLWNVPKYFIIEMGAPALQKTNLFCP